jgi:hypothetical protein
MYPRWTSSSATPAWPAPEGQRSKAFFSLISYQSQGGDPIRPPQAGEVLDDHDTARPSQLLPTWLATEGYDARPQLPSLLAAGGYDVTTVASTLPDKAPKPSRRKTWTTPKWRWKTQR